MFETIDSPKSSNLANLKNKIFFEILPKKKLNLFTFYSQNSKTPSRNLPNLRFEVSNVVITKKKLHFCKANVVDVFSVRWPYNLYLN